MLAVGERHSAGMAVLNFRAFRRTYVWSRFVVRSQPYGWTAHFVSRPKRYMYKAERVPAPTSCDTVQEYRTCLDGRLTGRPEYNLTRCTITTELSPVQTSPTPLPPTAPRVTEDYSCALGPWSGPPFVKHGHSVTMYRYSVVKPPITCEDWAQTRWCMSSLLSGSDQYSEPTCRVESSSQLSVTSNGEAPSWLRIMREIRTFIMNDRGRIPSFVPPIETLIAIGAILFSIVLFALKMFPSSPKPTTQAKASAEAPHPAPLHVEIPVPEPQKPRIDVEELLKENERLRAALESLRAPKPAPQQTVLQQTPPPKEKTKIQDQPTIKQSIPTSQPPSPQPPVPDSVFKLGLVGMGLSTLWFLYCTNFLYRSVGVPVSEISHFLPCFFWSSIICQVTQVGVGANGGPVHYPMYFWIPAIASVVGYLWRSTVLQK
jgi:hypothetical protein